MNRRDLSRLKTLREEEPAKIMPLVRLLWPDIRAAIHRGHTLKVIHSRLTETGIAISYHQLVVYVNRLRREDPIPSAGGTAPRLEKASPIHEDSHKEPASGEPDDAGRDPLANIRERLIQNRPGFNFDDGLPNKKTLIG